MQRRHIHGILLLDKPVALTSNGALQRVKYLFGAKKAGHTGSLDPIATGMLPICFGEATKFSQFMLDSDKLYTVVAKLGEQTNTGDSEGEIIATNSFDHVTEKLITEVAAKFVGEIQQIPPMFSAIKHKGKPLYELARRGIEVERQPRTVKIFSLKLKHFEHDRACFQVYCSKGTYIRTLIEDIGRELGCGAHVIELRRTTVTTFGNATMYTLPELESIAQTSGATALTELLLPVESSVQLFPAIKLSTSASFYLNQGQSIRLTLPINTPYVRLMSEDSRFLGIGEILPDGRVKPHRMVANQ